MTKLRGYSFVKKNLTKPIQYQPMPYTLTTYFNIILPTTSRSKEIKTTKKISLSVIRFGTERKIYLIRPDCSHYTTMCGTENPYDAYIFSLLTNKAKSNPPHQQTHLRICIHAFWTHLQHSKGLNRIFITLKALPL